VKFCEALGFNIMNSHICANAIVLDLAILEEKPTLITKSSNNEQKFIIKFGKY